MLKAHNARMLAGPVGDLETLVVEPKGAVTGIAVICHPNPLQGGTNGNKVVQTAARTLSQLGYVCYLPNLRGVGESGGVHDHGVGEVDDVLAVIGHARAAHGNLPLALAGFSFGVAVGKYVIPTPPVPADTLVIHGEEDEVIPLTAVLDWARPQSLPVLVLPGAGHFFHGRLVQLAEQIRRLW